MIEYEPTSFQLEEPELVIERTDEVQAQIDSVTDVTPNEPSQTSHAKPVPKSTRGMRLDEILGIEPALELAEELGGGIPMQFNSRGPGMRRR